jgi:hypothetical protein
MSIFRETFPEFIQEELDRRQSGILARTPRFIHELNTRSAWIRMTSGVNTLNKEGVVSNDLAKKYVLQAGTLTYKGSVVDEKTGEISNAYALKAGLGGALSTNAYSTTNAFGEKHRLGIRPMAGITGVSIKNKGAYGSLQEATVSFIAWDVRQLEELELLFMRPGYTVLLEFGWNYTKSIIPEYDILNKTDIELSKAFVEIYQKITNSEGNYDALLGYVTNYNWSARDDGGYDCTTTIISLGEVLESLKVNWVPINTYAFSTNGSGLLGLTIPPGKYKEISTSYDQGIIPGLLHEIWNYLTTQAVSKNTGITLTDTIFNAKYDLYINPNNTTVTQNDRNGYPKPLGKDVLTEAYITLGSFCDLLNNYVLLKGVNDNPLSQITAYETDASGRILTEQKQVVNNFTKPSKLPTFDPNRNSNPNQQIPQVSIPSNSIEVPSSLKCIASPLSISTNLGVCLVRNDNWQSLIVQAENAAKEEESNQTTPPTRNIKSDILIAIKAKTFSKRSPNAGGGNNIFAGNVYRRFQNKITNPADDNNYIYAGDLAADIKTLASDLLIAITKVDVRNVNGKQVPTFLFAPDGVNSFISPAFNEGVKTINFFDYFYKNKSTEQRITQAYEDIFIADYDGNREIGIAEDPAGGKSIFRDQNKTWTRGDIKALLESTLTQVQANTFIQEQLTKEIPEVAGALADAASKSPGVSSEINNFLVPISSEQTKTIGNISNIYVNINFLYSQAISRNIASNDTQNKNVISIREYLQGILREVQNSLGNINDFDVQVDSRNAIGRIIDINYTGDPSQTDLFELQIHNLNSIVRNYSFQSKIFPEMGSIIAISAQDINGIGKLGYDNATLVAWNEGVVDRLIPKRDFTSLIKLSKEDEPISFIYPFLTKMYDYFQATQGQSSDNLNFAYGGLNFAYRDFLAYLARIDERNNFKAIIPTELSVTLDGIGGIVIGNIFTINQDIIPRGYKSSTYDRSVAYIVTRIEHVLQDNDWTTTLKAYPIIYELKRGTNVLKDWKQQEYPGTKPGERIITISAGGVPIARLSTKSINQNNLRQAVRFFLDAGFTDIQVAALVGGFVQESGVNPEIVNKIGATGIAQWLSGRKTKLLSKAEPTSLITQLNFVIEEFNTDEKTAGNNLKKSKTLEEAIAAAASYERYAGINVGDGVTYDEVLRAPETGKRIGYTEDILARIRSGEFGSYTSPTDPNAEVNSIISDINKAASGFGTDEAGLIKAIGRIKSKETFTQVNNFVNIETILDSELGSGDRATTDSIKTKLAQIGVTLTYTPTINSNGTKGVKDIKIVF